jgi:DNA-directed RNA polymerase subunit M
MQFCPKCGAILVQKTKNMGCPRCNYFSKDKTQVKITEKIDERKEIPIVSKDINVNPIVEEECPKCSHKKAYFWMQQTRGSDESPTKFFKCVKCGETWRDYN